MIEASFKPKMSVAPLISFENIRVTLSTKSDIIDKIQAQIDNKLQMVSII